MRRASLALAGSLLALLLAIPASAGTVTVGSGSTLDLGTGHLDLGCADLEVAGTLTAGSVGFSAARDVAIAPGGTVNATSATLSLTGDWDNTGTFNAGASTVEMVDGCALLSGVVAGNSTFANLSIVTTSAKLVSFVSGSTQTVTGVLTLLGDVGGLLQLRSTLSGNAAFLDVAASSTDYVDVDDIDAQAGNNIVLSATSVKGPNTPGWTLGAVVPLLGPFALVALALLLLATAQGWLPRSTRADHTT